jgi:hypothetical protein
MAPEWNDLVRINRPVPGFVMAAIDCGRLHGICETLEGTTTPSVRYFAPNQKTGVAFTGEREVGPLAEWVKNVTNVEPYTAPGSLFFVVVDNHRSRFYNHSEIKKCEDLREIQFRALSNVDYRKEASRFCRNDSNNCIFVTNGQETTLFTGDVNVEELTAFLEISLPPELSTSSIVRYI